MIPQFKDFDKLKESFHPRDHKELRIIFEDLKYVNPSSHSPDFVMNKVLDKDWTVDSDVRHRILFGFW